MSLPLALNRPPGLNININLPGPPGLPQGILPGGCQQPTPCHSGKGKGAGKGKGKGKACHGGKRGRRNQGPKSPQQQMLQLMSMMIRLMGQMQSGGAAGGQSFSGQPGGLNININSFQNRGFF
ncbi:MAG TPA: hypothetical protein EYO33_18455 [Phycisphaerales bacterium]|nr:hypothetical protein [Phycisphaerales bacterium]